MPTKPTVQRARRLRQTANAPEEKAWQTLRKLRAYDYPVRRQHPIQGYIADFAIPKAKLVIEIDGSIHDRDDVASHDAVRQAEIEKAGWRVVRVNSELTMDGDRLFGIVAEMLGL